MKQKKSILVLAMTAAFIATLFLPGLVSAGSLEPSAPPASTMKTLDQIPPSWSQKITNASERFELVLDGNAVLDKETGLVWQQSPLTSPRSWFNALWHCYRIEVANRKGWRLPTVEELASLVDNDNSSPALPTGHPFDNVQSLFYWSSTTGADPTSYAWGVGFDFGAPYLNDKSESYHPWCVRGGYGHDAH